MRKVLLVFAIFFIGFLLIGCDEIPVEETKMLTMTFESNGGSDVAPITENENSDIQQPDDPTKEGYIFGGWYLESSLSTEVEWPYKLMSNITLYAKWYDITQVVTYRIQWEVDGVVVQDDLNVMEGTLPSYKGSTPTKAPTSQYSYTFSGWFPNVEVATSDQKYVAQFTQSINQYTIAFNTNGGSVISSQTVDYGTSISEPKDPIKEGFRLIGWYLDEGLSLEVEWPYQVIQHQTLYAKWIETVPYVQYLTTLLSSYNQSPLSHIPNTMLPGSNLISSEQAVIDYTTFVNMNHIPYGGFGEQWNMVVSNLKESQNFFNVLTIIDTLSTISVVAFNNHIDSNPSDSAQYSFNHGIYNITIKVEDAIIYYVVDYTGDFSIFGTQTVQIALSQNIFSGEKIGRIQIGEANALRYIANNNSYQFAIKYGGIRRAYFEIYKDENDNVEGRIFEYLGIDGSFTTGSAAEFYIDDDYVSVVGNKSSSMMGWTGTINELYNKNTGKLLGYEVRETFSSITYNTMWFNLGDTSGISTIKFLIAPLENSNPHLVYVNNLETEFKSKLYGGFSLKTLSRRYDIELRKQYFFYQIDEEIIQVEILIPMIFVQQEHLDNLVTDVNNENGGLNFSLNISSAIQNKIKDDYSQLIDPFITRKEEYTVQMILDFIGFAHNFTE